MQKKQTFFYPKNLLRGILCLLAFTGCFELKGQSVAKDSSRNGVAAQVQDLQLIRRKAYESLNSRDWQAAHNFFSQVLKIVPKDVYSLYGNALALFNLGYYEDSVTNIDAGINILSNIQENLILQTDFLVLSAIISAVQKDNAAAVEKLEKAVSISPTHFDANFSLARAYFGAGDMGKAIDYFQRAASLQPQHLENRFFLATALERIGNTKEAILNYRKVLEINPNSASGNLGLGSLLVKVEGNKSEEGLNSLRKAVAIDGNSYEARLVLGKTLLQLKSYEAAVEHLERAILLANGNPEPHFQLAIAYRKLGRKADAEEQNRIVKEIHEKRRKTQ